MFYKLINRNTLLDLLSIGLPFLLFLAHASLLKSWIIDDSGISFVYARNLAQGFGLVSQPGFSPVEGYSNFTWVILMVPFFLAEIFNPLVTPKAISIVLILITFFMIREINRLTLRHHKFGTAFVLTFLAINTSFVVWTTSGLENPLYVLLATLILWKLLQLSDERKINNRLVISIAIFSALCALTRPDGILYFLVFPFLMVTDFILKKNNLQNIIKGLVIYTGIFLLIFGSYMLFRFTYFDDILPNTYYAKGGLPYLSHNDIYEKAVNLFQSVSVLPIFTASLISMFIYGSFTKKFTKQNLILSIMLIISILIYLLLPRDWMPEYRFATPFFVFFYIFVFAIGEISWERLRMHRPFLIGVNVLVLVFILTSIFSYYKRTNLFLQEPTVPFSFVSERYGHFFNNFSKELNLENGSLLAPDLGGTLYYSELKVYDLAGLTDKTIGRNLGRDQAAFYDYVFETLKPTFIHTHQWWAYVSNFDADPRFRQDYIAINERQDGWVMTNFGISIFSGDYVRKDATEGYLEILQEIQLYSVEGP